MAKGNDVACINVTLGYEGGYSKVRSDPGNWTGGKVGRGVLKGTNYGIAASTHPNLDIKALTLANARTIYKREYWQPIRGDDLPAGVDLSTYDYGVNSGPSRSVKALQSVVGVRRDGAVGPVTLTALAKLDGKTVIQKHCAKRSSFLRGLSSWKTFGRGWAARVANVEAKAVAMWLARGGALTHKDMATLDEEGKKAGKTADSQKTGAGTVAGGGVVGGGADTVASGGPNWIIIAGVAVAVIVTVAILIHRSRTNRARSEAYAATARGL